MQRAILVVIFLHVLCFLGFAQNDICQDAVNINCGQYIPGSTIPASWDPGVPDCGPANVSGPGVWYEFLGNGDDVTFSTCPDASFDTKIGVYTGTCGNVSCVAGNDDAPNCSLFRSEVTVSTTWGVTYYILVSGFGNNTGTFIISATCVSSCGNPPANNDCESPTALSVFPAGTGSPYVTNNNCATPAASNPSCDFFSTLSDVWFTFNTGPETNILFSLNTLTANNLQYALYDTCNGTELYCNYGNGEVFTSLTPFTDYIVQVWTDNPLDQGEFGVLFNAVPFPCYNPSSVSIYYLTDTTAEIQWYSSNPNSTFYLEWGDTNYTSGNFMGSASGPSPSNLNTYVITGLTADSYYDFYLSETCPNGGYTPLLGAYSFLTPLYACNTISAIATVNITDTTADVSWSSSNTTANWTIEWGPQGFAPGSGIGLQTGASTQGMNSFTISGLSPDTDYEYYLIEECPGGGSSPLAGPVAFTTFPTPCQDPFSLQYFNLTQTSATLQWESFNLGDTYLVEWGPVGFLPGTGVGNSFGTSLWGINTVNATGLNPNTTYEFYVMEDCGGSNKSETVGPIIFTTLAPDCPQPDSVNTLNITPYQADIQWVSSSPGAGFVLEWGPAGFVPGMGDSITGTSQAGNNQISFLNLQPETAYEYYLTEDCGWNTLTDVAGPFSFVSLYISPLNDDCEDAIAVECGSFYDGFTAPSPTDSVNDCGTAINTNASGVWYVFEGTGQLISLNTCNNTNFNSTISVFEGGCSSLICVDGNDDGAICPNNGSLLSFLSVFGTEYLFYIGGMNNEYGEFELSVSCGDPCLPAPTNGNCSSAAMLNVIGELECNQVDGSNLCAYPSGVIPSNAGGSQVQDVWFTFNSGANTEVDLEFTGLNNLSFNFAIYADCGITEILTGMAQSTTLTGLLPGQDYWIQIWNGGGQDAGNFTLCLHSTLSCLSPQNLSATNLTDSSAFLQWLSGNSGATFVLEWGPAGFVPGNGIGTESGTSLIGINGLEITGLDYNTSYEFYILEECGAAGSSENVGPGSFITLFPECNPPSQLIAQNIGANHADLGWYSTNPGATYTIEWGPVGFTPGAGSGTLSGTSLSGSNLAVLSGLSSATTYDFYINESCLAGNESDMVGPYSFQTTTILCLPPSNFLVTSVDETSAEVSWTSNNNGVGYLLEWGPPGFIPGNGTGFTSGTGVNGSNVAMITGLSPNSSYEIYLVENCGGSFSLLVGPLAFNTLDVGLYQESQGYSLAVFPNPAQDVVHLHFSEQMKEPLSVQLWSTQGKQIKVFYDLNCTQCTLSMEDVTAGLYFLEVQTTQQKTVQKLIIE